MNLRDYTPNHICRVLGMDGFYTRWKRGAPAHELTALLCPSFSPEVHLAFWGESGATKVRTTCAESQIWQSLENATVPVAAEESVIGNLPLEVLEQDFRSAVYQPDKRRFVIADGMTVHIAWRDYDTRLVVEGANPTADEALGRYVSTLVSIAFDVVRNERCRDSLASAGQYVGLELPRSATV